MKNLNAPKLLLTLLLTVIVSACSHVTVKDKEVCADMGPYGAHCAHTYIEDKRDIPKADWDVERVGWMCTLSDDFSDTEDSIDELCRITEKCDYETKEKIKKFKEHMKPLVDEAQGIRSFLLQDVKP